MTTPTPLTEAEIKCGEAHILGYAAIHPLRRLFEYQAATIRALQAAVKAREWVTVDVALPPDGNLYWVTCLNSLNGDTFIARARYNSTQDIWEDEDSDSFFDADMDPVLAYAPYVEPAPYTPPAEERK